MTQRVVNYTYGTGNPVLPDGSIDVRDGIDNLQSLDVFMNAPEDTYNQRDGEIVRTVSGMNNEFDGQIINMGFTRVGTFAAGATLTNPRQTLLWDVADGGDGQEYGWSGSFPKVVPATSTPASTGGISVGAWISRFDPELRNYVLNTTAATFKNEHGYSAIENMIAGRIGGVAGAVVHRAGGIYNTGGTNWKAVNGDRGYPTPSGYKLIPVNGIWFQDYGADSTGVTPCSDLLNAAITDLATYNINAAIRLCHGDFLFNSTVEYLSGTRIRGEGRRGDYNYVSEDDAGGTLIIVADGVTAFQTNSKWCLYPEISGVTFRANTHGSSTYGSVANYSPNTNAIDVLYSIDGEFNNLAFESIDKAMFNRLGSGQESLRPKISDLVAQDCNYVMKFINGAADVHVSCIPICLHCNYMINCDKVDGFHFSDIRFFQSYNDSVSFTDSQFINGSNIVLFETANTQMTINNCDNVNISALTLSRAGWYHIGTPFPQRLALNVLNSRNVKIQGIIERPSGKAINVDGCDLVDIDMCVKLPYNTNGGASATTIFNSKNVNVAGVYKIRGNTSNAVEADNASRYEVFSKVTSDAFDKNLRFIDTNAFNFEGGIASGTVIGSSGTSSPLIRRKIKVPAGKKLILGHIRYDNTNGLRPRIGNNFFLTATSTNEGVEDSSQYVLLDNSAGVTVAEYELAVSLHNNTGAIINTGLDTVTCYLKLLAN